MGAGERHGVRDGVPHCTRVSRLVLVENVFSFLYVFGAGDHALFRKYLFQGGWIGIFRSVPGFTFDR